jgi:hypothetical protein
MHTNERHGTLFVEEAYIGQSASSGLTGSPQAIVQRPLQIEGGQAWEAIQHLSELQEVRLRGHLRAGSHLSTMNDHLMTQLASSGERDNSLSSDATRLNVTGNNFPPDPGGGGNIPQPRHGSPKHPRHRKRLGWDDRHWGGFLHENMQVQLPSPKIATPTLLERTPWISIDQPHRTAISALEMRPKDMYTAVHSGLLGRLFPSMVAL